MKRLSILGVLVITLGLGMNCTEQTPSTARLYSTDVGYEYAARAAVIEMEYRIERLENKVRNMERYIKKTTGLLGTFSESPYQSQMEPSLDERIEELETKVSDTSRIQYSVNSLAIDLYKMQTEMKSLAHASAMDTLVFIAQNKDVFRKIMASPDANSLALVPSSPPTPFGRIVSELAAQGEPNHPGNRFRALVEATEKDPNLPYRLRGETPPAPPKR